MNITGLKFNRIIAHEIVQRDAKFRAILENNIIPLDANENVE